VGAVDFAHSAFAELGYDLVLTEPVGDHWSN
jgi:hypothetical protein